MKVNNSGTAMPHCHRTPMIGGYPMGDDWNGWNLLPFRIRPLEPDSENKRRE
jgi:hypothetical protein